MSVSIEIRSEELAGLVADVDRLGDAMKSRELLQIVGRSMQQTVKNHLEEISRDTLHHRSADSLGAARTGFYERASQAVQAPQAEDDGVSVSILHQGLAQRYFGGTIRAKEGHLLTIPARTEAYGKRAREFANLRLIMFPSGAGALVEREATVWKGGKSPRGARKIAGSIAEKTKGTEIGGGVFYWLVQQVHQDPDPTVLPTSEAILDPALAEVRDFIGLQFERKSA